MTIKACNGSEFEIGLDGYLSEKLQQDIYEITEFRSYHRAIGNWEEADFDRKYLDEIGVKVTDLDRYTTRYEFAGATWKITMPKKE